MAKETKASTPGTAVASQKKAPPTVVGMVMAAEKNIKAVLPAHMDFEKVMQSVRLAVAQNPGLASCDPKTVLFSVMAACRLGLEINSPLHEAALVPFKTECTLMIEYRGFQTLARRSPDVSRIEARVVVSDDQFNYELGTRPRIDHKPKGTPKGDGSNVTHAYAIAFLKDGSYIFDVLTRDDVEAARAVSRMRGGDTWTKWYGEMARKTAVRRLSKYLPLSPEMAAAVELDIRGDTGEVSAPSALIDSPESMSAQVASKTQDKLEEVKARLGGQGEGSTAGATPSDAPTPVESEQAPAPTSAGAESGAAAPAGEDDQPF